jgi:hypothetical protein
MNNHPTPTPSGEAEFIIGPAESRTHWLRPMWSTLSLQGCWPPALDELGAARRMHNIPASHLAPEVETCRNDSQGLRGLAQA